MRAILALIAGLASLVSGAAMAQVTPFSTTLPKPIDRAHLISVFSRTLNVLDYGAKCDGATDDTTAFQAAATAALTGSAASNGGAVIVLPAGRCMISKAITFALGSNSAISIRGQGELASEVFQTGGTDGLVFNYPLTGGQLARTAANPGAGIYLHDFAMVQADPQNRTIGRAIALLGPSPATYKVPSGTTIISKMSFQSQLGTGAAGSATNTTQNWLDDIMIQDVSNILIQDLQIIHYDFGNGTEKDIRIVSTSPNNTFTGNAAGGITMLNVFGTGGNTGLSIEGNNVQGIVFQGGGWTAVSHGIHWDCSSCGNGFNGPLLVDGTGMGVQVDGVYTSNVTNVQVKSVQIIGSNGSTNINWCGICVDNTEGSAVSGNILQNLPNQSTIGGSPYVATAMRVGNNKGQYESTVSGNSIGGTDNGLVLYGPVNASGNTLQIISTIPETPYTDITNTGQSVPHPVVTALSVAGVRYDYGLNAPAIHAGGDQFNNNATFAGGATFSSPASFSKATTLGGGTIDSSALIQGGMISGHSNNALANSDGVIFGCSGTLAAYTFTIPYNAVQGQLYHLSSECTITALTLSSQAGTTITGSPGTISPSTPLTFIFDATNNIWARF